MLNYYVIWELLPRVRNAQDIIGAFVRAWDDYTVFACSMHRMFKYLDRFYLRYPEPQCG